MLWFRTLIFILLIPGSVMGWIPYYLLSSHGQWRFRESSFWNCIGIFLMIAGVLVILRCSWDFVTRGKGTPVIWDSPKVFVSHGFYRYVRNPMYLGGVITILGETAFFQSRILFIYTIIVWLCFHLFVILYEEPHLTRKFGDSYKVYCKTVARWIPKK